MSGHSVSPAQFGASVGSGFVPILPVPEFAVLVVYEPFVVSIFRKFVFVESGVADAGALIELVSRVVRVCIPIGPFHTGSMLSLSLLFFFSCSPIFLDSNLFLLYLLPQLVSLYPSFELIICYSCYFYATAHSKFKIRVPAYVIMLSSIGIFDEFGGINYLWDYVPVCIL